MTYDDLPLTIPVLLGTTREGRRSVHVARFVAEALAARPGVATDLIDLKEFDLPVFRERPQEAEAPPAGFGAFAARVAAADALVIVSPEYKGGIPGVLKNALDHLEPGVFRRKPVAIATVSGGAFGGMNCLAQLRLVTLAMGGLPVPATFLVSDVNAAFDDRGAPAEPRLASRLATFLDELIWYAQATTARRRGE
jgi:NAD(P)H-dependent FMN reductase